MNLKRRLLRDFVCALLCALLVTVIYERLEHTRHYHGIAVKALGPAIDLVWHRLDPNCYERPSCHFEVLAANTFLYCFWTWLGLCVVEVVRYAKRYGCGTENAVSL